MTELFNEEVVDQTPQEVVEQKPIEPTIPQELVEFVGEGKKYKSLEEVYKAFPHSQSHISKLESELAQLREELSKRKTAEDLLKEIESRGFSANTPDHLDDSQNQTGSVAPSVDIEKVVESILTKKSVEATQQANASSVVEAFKSNFGEKAKEVYTKLAESNGLPVSELDRMAKLSPQLVLNLAGIKPKSPTQSGKVGGDVNTVFSNNVESVPSAKVGDLSNTKEVTRAWRAAKEAVLKLYED